MTAPPTAVPSPPRMADGGNALAALFAAAALHRQTPNSKTSSPIISKSPSTKTTTTNDKTKSAATPSSSKISIETRSNDKDSNSSAAQLLASLLNGAASSSSSSSSTASSATTNKQTANNKLLSNNVTMPNAKVQNVSSIETMPSPVVLRNLESWHDENEDQVDDSCYQELVDSGNRNGWSADEMFKYNERRHKVASSYNEKTLAGNYTTPLSKNKSKSTNRLATQLAKEIKDRVIAEGRITPESSDDDELFESRLTHKVQLKQLKQLDQLKNLKAINNITISNNCQLQSRFSSTLNGRPLNHQHVLTGTRKSNKSSSQYSNSSATPATASLSSSPTLNDSSNVIKPVTSSSRNILRTCLT